MATKSKMAAGTSKTAAQHVDLDLTFVASNDEQPRGQGVCPNLKEIGVGVLARITTDVTGKKALKEEDIKPCLWEQLFSDNADERTAGLVLVKDNEPDVWKFALDLHEFGQAHPIGVRPALNEKGEDSGKWNIIYGMRRALSKAIIWAAGQMSEADQKEKLGVAKAVFQDASDKPTVRAVLVDWITDPQKLMLLALTENTSRKDQTPVDEAKHYAALKKLGMNLQQVAEVTGEDYQTVRNRLQILKLPQVDQDKIHEGKLSWTRAIKKLAGQEGDGKTAPVAGNNTEGGRRRMPTIKQVEPVYLATEKPEDMSDEEWGLVTEDVRKWMAFHAGFEYLTRKQIKEKKAQDERAALIAEQARKAAEAGEEKAAAAK